MRKKCVIIIIRNYFYLENLVSFWGWVRLVGYGCAGKDKELISLG